MRKPETLQIELSWKLKIAFLIIFCTSSPIGINYSQVTLNKWRSVPDIVRVHPERSDIISDSLYQNCFIVCSSSIGSNGYNDCLVKSGNVDDNTEDDDGDKKLEDTLGNIDIDILFSVLVRVADCCESETRIKHINRETFENSQITFQKQFLWLCKYYSRGRCCWGGRVSWGRCRHRWHCPRWMAKTKLEWEGLILRSWIEKFM